MTHQPAATTPPPLRFRDLWVGKGPAAGVTTAGKIGVQKYQGPQTWDKLRNIDIPGDTFYAFAVSENGYVVIAQSDYDPFDIDKAKNLKCWIAPPTKGRTLGTQELARNIWQAFALPAPETRQKIGTTLAASHPEYRDTEPDNSMNLLQEWGNTAKRRARRRGPYRMATAHVRALTRQYETAPSFAARLTRILGEGLLTVGPGPIGLYEAGHAIVTANPNVGAIAVKGLVFLGVSATAAALAIRDIQAPHTVKYLRQNKTPRTHR